MLSREWLGPLQLRLILHSNVDYCAKLQSCLTLWDPMDCSLPGSSVHGIFQARILEWVARPFSRKSSRLRDWTCVSYVSAWQAGSLLGAPPVKPCMTDYFPQISVPRVTPLEGSTSASYDNRCFFPLIPCYAVRCYFPSLTFCCHFFFFEEEAICEFIE